MTSRAPSILLPEAPKASVITRLLIAPIAFASFLLSLALIDNRNASFRQHIHAPSHSSSPDGFIGRAKNTLHSWAFRPQPYAYVKSPDALQRQKSGEIVREQLTKEERWHWNSQQKKMMKMEVTEAFEMRKWVVLAMAVGVAVFAALVVWAVGWSYGMIMIIMYSVPVVQ